MSQYVLIVAVAVIVVFTVMAAGTVYCNLHNMDVAIDSNNEVLHFYDLATSPFYEGEESQKAFDDLLDFLHKRNQGQKCRLSEAARERYVPVTKRSTVWLSLLSLLEVAKMVGIILLVFAILFVALVVAGTPL